MEKTRDLNSEFIIPCFSKCMPIGTNYMRINIQPRCLSRQWTNKFHCVRYIIKERDNFETWLNYKRHRWWFSITAANTGDSNNYNF